jgi:hypothetical protein
MTPDDADNEFEKLKQLPVSKLHERFESVYGETPRSRNKVWLVRKILWRLQSRKDGGLSERARLRATELAINADIRLMPAKRAVAIKVKPSEPPDPTSERSSHDHRLPLPGQSIVRDYKGRHIEVWVTPDGFEYDGEHYKSLSAIAKSITGSHCNGFRFFQLRNR